MLTESELPEHKQFEIKIARIAALLAEVGEIVVHDVELPDPHNPSQLRQIDITVTSERRVTHIECRHHATPQDVGWVECLIGRKLSLGAERIIGVSSSGFTAGAKAKAKAFGIYLYDLRILDDDEIMSWTNTAKVYVFGSIIEQFILDVQTPAGSTVDEQRKIRELLLQPEVSEGLISTGLNGLASCPELSPTPEGDSFKLTAFSKLQFNYTFEEHPVLKDQNIAKLSGAFKFKPFSVELRLPLTLVMKDVNNPETTLAISQESKESKDKVLLANGKLAWVIDLSALELPEGHHLSGYLLAAQTAVTPGTFTNIGKPKTRISNLNVELIVRELDESVDILNTEFIGGMMIQRFVLDPSNPNSEDWKRYQLLSQTQSLANDDRPTTS